MWKKQDLIKQAQKKFDLKTNKTQLDVTLGTHFLSLMKPKTRFRTQRFHRRVLGNARASFRSLKMARESDPFR